MGAGGGEGKGNAGGSGDGGGDGGWVRPIAFALRMASIAFAFTKPWIAIDRPDMPSISARMAQPVVLAGAGLDVVGGPRHKSSMFTCDIRAESVLASASAMEPQLRMAAGISAPPPL